MRSSRFALSLSVLALGACSGAAPSTSPAPRRSLVSTPEGSVGRIDVRQIEARPRLTLVSREGDPVPALVATVVTELGSIATTALASVVEGRLRAAGLDVDARVDRSAFRVRMLAPDSARAVLFLRALAAAYAQPIAIGAPEVALADERVRALRQSPLDAPELSPIAACTGRLGVAGSEPLVALSTPAGARELDEWRKAALHAGRTSLAAVGPDAFCFEAARALELVDTWPAGNPPADAWPSADTLGIYATNQLDRRGVRVTVAARVANAQAAVAAAEQIGAPDSALRSRLGALPAPFRAVEVLGVARPHSGCVAVTVEASILPAATSFETSAALATALVRQEVHRELAAAPSPTIATRQILAARDPRDAGARASWWALSGNSPDRPERWATALGVPAIPDLSKTATAATPASGARLFEIELGRALATAAQPMVERRTLVERGQGEVWVLLASPCGVVEEGVYDAGSTALAALAAVQTRRRESDVALEPWITADAVGIIAHAPFRDEREKPAELGRRVAGAAARTLAATAVGAESLTLARAVALSHLEQVAGRQAAALGAFIGAIAPDHPSWLDPFGVWERVASAALETVQLRWQALAAGPLRVAVLANADAAQATAAADAVGRWLVPRVISRACSVPSAGQSPRVGRHDVRLPEGTPFAQVLLGVQLPPVGRDLAHLTAAALDGSDGLLAAALGVGVSSTGPPNGATPRQPLNARASARVVGGARTAALIVEIKAPSTEIDEAEARIKELLLTLAQRASDADLNRAESKVVRGERDALADPRRRLINLWNGRTSTAPLAKSTLAGWRAWLAGALGSDTVVTVEARPD